jgi:hypothetical protein
MAQSLWKTIFQESPLGRGTIWARRFPGIDAPFKVDQSQDNNDQWHFYAHMTRAGQPDDTTEVPLWSIHSWRPL